MKPVPGEFFPMPKVIFRLGLTPNEMAAYAYLKFLENRRTYQCWPSYTTIGSAIGRSKKSVAKYIAGLEDKGLIRTEPTEMVTQGGVPLNGNLLYTLLPVRHALDVYNERQFRKAELENERRRVQALLSQSAG